MRALCLIFSLVLASGFASAGCAPDTASLRGPWGQADFAVEVADTSQTRSLGLMYREKMPRFAGMIFVYEAPVHARFWMKNTRLSLDMLFFDSNGVLTVIRERATPESLEVIDGGRDVLLVLEINGGLVRDLGITPGSELRHAALGAQAHWPCE